MTHHRPSKKSIEIFSGAMWPQRHLWQKAIPPLPTNSYLLVINPDNEKQARLMQRLARYFRNKGRQVHIWVSPTQSSNNEYQK